MLQSLGLNDNEMRLLYAKLGSAMETVAPDDRSFSDITGALTPLLTSDLMPAFQRLIANHASVPRCEKPKDNVQVTMSAGQGNSTAETRTDLLNQTAEAKRIGKMALNLRIRDSRVLTAEDRASPEWQQAFTAYTNALAEWQQPQGESDALFFHERVFAWMQAADMAVTPDSRAYAVDEGVRVIATSPLENSDPAEWFWQAIHAIPGRQPGVELLAGFERSGNPVLTLYAALVKLLGPNLLQ
jgi:hypothetical protein